MKKRLLSLLMAVCLMFTLVPAAFAEGDGPDVLTLPNGDTYEIPDMELANADDVTPDDLAVRTEAISLMDAEEETVPDSGYAGSGSSADPYRVYSAKGLMNLGKDQFGGAKLVASYVYLMNNINMDEVTLETDYVFYYFAGVIQSDPALIAAGTPAVIKGLPTGKELVYAWFLGTMGYFNIDLNGEASRLNWLPGMVGGQYLPTSVQNVNVYSGSINDDAKRVPVNVAGADSMANYAPFVFTTGGDFTMKNCANYADITTTSYGSVFYGYYPFDEVGTYTFTNCVNYGTVTMRHAAMFFGNNTPFASGGANNAFAFHEDLTQNHIQFEGCKNEGKIRGTDSANLFATRAAGADAISDAYETYLRSSGVMTETSVELIGKDLGMKLYADAAGNLTMDPSSDPSVDYYQVSVYTYVQAFTKDNNEYSWYGNARYGTQERLDNGNTTITLKKYGVCDYPDAVDVGQIEDLYVVSKDGVNYYWLDNEKAYVAAGKEFYWFVSRDRTPNGIKTPDIVVLAAYSSDGTLLGTVSDIPLPTVES